MQSDAPKAVEAFFINFARFHQPIFFQLCCPLLCYPHPSNQNVLVQSTPYPRFSQRVADFAPVFSGLKESACV